MNDGSKQEVTVSIAQGHLRGQLITGVWGHRFYAFKGIPYAKPPVGPLRFKSPQPADGWSGVRDATKYGSVAPQISIFTNQYEGDEDCLYINVYTPKLPTAGSSTALPVMFMVHGGGLCLMSGHFVEPDYLIQHDVIMVSFNYRLGPLGFLSTGDSVVPGNMGFKDQVLALRWTKDNIAKFGGDPDNITVFGGSAGGWSTHALMLSPLAKGLFHGAIAMSGVAIGDGVCSRHVRERSFLLAEHLGLRTKDSQDLLDFMSRQTARDIIEKSMLGRTKEDIEKGLMFPFVGTVEPDEEGAFFPRHPLDILKSGEYHKVPLITGVATFEGSCFLGTLRNNPNLAASIAANPELLVPEDISCTDDQRKLLGQKIKKFYFGDKPVNDETIKELLTALGDTMFSYAAVRAAKIHAMQELPVYLYLADYKVNEEMPSFLQIPPALKDAGSPHGADMSYVWHIPVGDESIEPDSVKGQMINKTTRMWTNFAKSGMPTPVDAPVLAGLPWPQFSVQHGHYLRFTNGRLDVEQWPFRDTVHFWDQLYEQLGH